MKAVEEAYYEETLYAVFLTLMQVMEEILKCKGKNTYRLPHRKEKLRRAGTLPMIPTYDRFWNHHRDLFPNLDILTLVLFIDFSCGVLTTGVEIPSAVIEL